MSKLNHRQQAFADEYIISGNVYGVVYLITNKINDKKYVGITRRTVNERLSEHCKADSYIGKAIRKYGLGNFNIKVLDIAFSEKSLFKKEIEYIAELETFGSGYNLTNGGDGVDKRVKLNRELTDKQIAFMNKVKEYNKSFVPQVENREKMIQFTLLNTILLYLECEYEQEVRLVSNTILKLKKEFMSAILKTKIISAEEVVKYAQKKSSLGVLDNG